MSSNRLQYFIRNILQNSTLNREKFVKNKKRYNDLLVKNKKNYNLILKRNYNTYSYGLPPPNNNNKKWILIGLYAIWTYMFTGKLMNKKK